MESHFLFQFEFMRILRLARANQSLPFRRTGNVFNVRAVTVNQAKVFHHVLHAAVWTFNVKARSKHRDAPEPTTGRRGMPSQSDLRPLKAKHAAGCIRPIAVLALDGPVEHD